MAEKDGTLRWWITSQPIRFLGMNGEPFAILAFIPLFPFPFFFKFVGWVLLINVVLSFVFRKNLVGMGRQLKRYLFNNRIRVYSSREGVARFKGYL